MFVYYCVSAEVTGDRKVETGFERDLLDAALWIANSVWGLDFEWDSRLGRVGASAEDVRFKTGGAFLCFWTITQIVLLVFFLCDAKSWFYLEVSAEEAELVRLGPQEPEHRFGRIKIERLIVSGRVRILRALAM